MAKSCGNPDPRGPCHARGLSARGLLWRHQQAVAPVSRAGTENRREAAKRQKTRPGQQTHRSSCLGKARGQGWHGNEQLLVTFLSVSSLNQKNNKHRLRWLQGMSTRARETPDSPSCSSPFEPAQGTEVAGWVTACRSLTKGALPECRIPQGLTQS